jgi:hypothetical protein
MAFLGEIAATTLPVVDREYSQRLSDPSSQSSVGWKTCKMINLEQSSSLLTFLWQVQL